MTLRDGILGMRLRVICRARTLGNVGAGCHEAGISRALSTRWRRRPGRPPQTPPLVERLVVGMVLAWPTWGCGRLAAHLAHQGLAPSTVQRILRRAGLPTRRGRLTVLEHHSARTVGLLTARSRQDLERARRLLRRHVEAQVPGELVWPDTFYLGKLKGAGPVWQLTACDAPCSYTVARLLPALSAQAVAAFLGEVLGPLFRRAGWPLRRVLTGGGSEFKGPSDKGAGRSAFGTRRPSPAMPGPMGSWNASTARSSRSSAASSSAAATSPAGRPCKQRLDRFLRFSKTRRPHQRYRLRGRPPAALFSGAVAVVS